MSSNEEELFRVSMNFDEETSKKIVLIYRYMYNKWVDKERKDKPTKLGMVSGLIGDLYSDMEVGGYFDE